MVLSRREFEVSKMFSLGFIAKEIAGSLFLSPRTIESHKKNVFTKNQNINNIADLVREFVLSYGDPKKAKFLTSIISVIIL